MKADVLVMMTKAGTNGDGGKYGQLKVVWMLERGSMRTVPSAACQPALDLRLPPDGQSTQQPTQR